MRLDRFLFFVRLLKTRSLAQSLIEAGNVRLDGKRVAKPAEEVHLGSVISFALHGCVRVVRVLTIPARRGPASEARACYKELDERHETENVSQQGPAN